ncbi:hypothetical protein [Methylocystis hirsuta]|uniref:DUF1508 domain-containing protein n=1 Tax=Methylocystis hirsuta TaxID=369798 RepID=A0A3M9XUA1_9HYPH|nr:hypothetical protein [Methylocystis hirsuta]RNJ51372.1 hypothetical protein D1O30_19005 [Methylocystis hirsuta]
MRANGKRVYALDSWTVEKKARGWYISCTYSSAHRFGPYRSEASACLMIARQLRRELARRDNHHMEPR